MGATLECEVSFRRGGGAGTKVSTLIFHALNIFGIEQGKDWVESACSLRNIVDYEMSGRSSCVRIGRGFLAIMIYHDLLVRVCHE